MNLELLLKEISFITKRHEEIYNLSGEKFNIFTLLDLGNYETNHSKIIATLLNPQGMHGKGNKFLGIFVECLGIKDFFVDAVKVETEKSICDGRIDIVLTNNMSRQIIIENKIYADDQPNQLLRYHKSNTDAYLIYLTLDGRDPSEYSTGKKEEFDYEIHNVSYKEDILKWLEQCKMESIDNPLLRETLTQYIVLIKQLTGQARSKDMQEEYLDTILKDADNVAAAFVISQNIDEIRLKILTDKFHPLISKLATDLKFNADISLKGCSNRYWGFSFKKDGWKNFTIRFEFQYANLGGLIYGGICGPNVSKELDDYLRGLKNYKQSGWALYKYMDNYRDWDDTFFRELYSNSDNIVSYFKAKIEEISSIVENTGYEL